MAAWAVAALLSMATQPVIGEGTRRAFCHCTEGDRLA
jgi:hypothetical protein